MEQILITTPYGQLATQPCTSEEMSQVNTEILTKLGLLQYISFILDNGNNIYMSKDMIGQCVFEVVKVS